MSVSLTGDLFHVLFWVHMFFNVLQSHSEPLAKLKLKTSDSVRGIFWMTISHCLNSSVFDNRFCIVNFFAVSN